MTSQPTKRREVPPLLPSAGVETVTWLVELGVGIVCLAVGVVTLRRARMRMVGALLVIAGLAAAGHATMQLTA